MLSCERSSPPNSGLVTKPLHRPPGDQVADDNAIDMAFAHRDLVDADHHRRGRSCLCQLRPHVLLLQVLDRMPVQSQLARHIAHRSPTAPSPDVHRKALRVARIVGQKRQTLQLHSATATTVHTSRLELQNHPIAATAQVAHAPAPTVVPASARLAAAAAMRFFERRSRLTISVPAAPSTSRIVARGRNPGYLYTSDNRRFGLVCSPMPKRASFLATPDQQKPQYPQASDPL